MKTINEAHYKHGADWYVYCHTCSKRCWGSESRIRWDGKIVCPQCWEPPNPQLFVHLKPEYNDVPYAAPDPAPSDDLEHEAFDAKTDNINVVT